MNKYFKNLLIITASVFSTAGVYAQTIEIQGGKSHDFYPEASGFTDCYVYMKNIGSSSLRIAYEKVSVDYPTGWDVSFCDNRNCFFNFRDKDTFTAMAPAEKASIKITIFPKGTADTAVIKYAVWDVDNPSVKDTITFNIMVRWSAGTQLSVMPQQAIYPIPANRDLQVNTLGVDYIEILDLSGKQVGHFYPNADWTRLDISHLTLGSYVMLLKGKNFSRNYTFLKN